MLVEGEWFDIVAGVTATYFELPLSSIGKKICGHCPKLAAYSTLSSYQADSDIGVLFVCRYHYELFLKLGKEV